MFLTTVVKQAKKTEDCHLCYNITQLHIKININ